MIPSGGHLHADAGAADADAARRGGECIRSVQGRRAQTQRAGGHRPSAQWPGVLAQCAGTGTSTQHAWAGCVNAQGLGTLTQRAGAGALTQRTKGVGASTQHTG
jgi:hypothetical protein